MYDFDREDLSFFKDYLLTVLSDRKLRCFFGCFYCLSDA